MRWYVTFIIAMNFAEEERGLWSATGGGSAERRRTTLIQIRRRAEAFRSRQVSLTSFSHWVHGEN